MSKAVLVMEMPERCGECLFCGEADNCMAMEAYGIDDVQNKPEWCPLKPMPEKNDSEYYSDYARGHKHGWNDAIKAIENNPHKQCGYSNK